MTASLKFRRTVLIVDDEPVNREMLGVILSEDYDVLFAENGREALELMRRHSRILSLVLLDLMMPVMDGFAVLAQLRREEALRRIPVIVLTAEKQAEIESLDLGAVDFIPKPYDMPDVILARIRRSIELSEDTSLIQNTERDALTGLYVRDFFFEYCHQLETFRPEQARDAVTFNVNRFHTLNELYGRSYGDSLLRRIALALREMLDNTEGLACRAGADTFYLFLNHREDYEAVLQRVLDRIHQDDEPGRVRLRAGVYQNADKSLPLERRFDRSTMAANSIRNNYGAGVAFYDAKMQERELLSERLIEGMEEAIRDKQFRVFYQPKCDVTGEKPVLDSAEALIRWKHPDFGMLSPGIFIPLFEENGLIHRLNRFVWEEAAEQIRLWRREYGLTLPVSVNVSRIDLYDPQLESELLDIAARHELTPGDLRLEITESAYTENSHQIVQVVESLRRAGFEVEMDDFGSGYSSLNMLTMLPIDALKLDMGFVRNVAKSAKDFHMIEMVVGIAKFLSLPVIAEGVEEKEQYDLLKKAGCEVIQGYYFSRPIPPEEFARFVEEKAKG